MSIASRLLLGCVLGFAALGQPSFAQEPDPLLAHCRTVRMIIPYSAGGGGDIGARLLAPYLSEQIGVPVQPENLPGAGSQIGVTQMTSAAPDGCTIGWTHLPAVIAIYNDPGRQAAFKREDIAPIAMFVVDPGGIAVRGDAPYDNLTELVEAAKQAPGTITISDSGVLSDGHLLLLELEERSGADFRIVHSAGGGEAMADLLGGHTDGMTINLGGANIELAATGQIKVLGVFTKEPVSGYPGVQTATEQGYPMTSATSRALSAPGGTPQNVVDRLSEAVGKAMEDPEFQEQAKKLGLAVRYMDAQELESYWDESEKAVAPLIAKHLKEG